MATLDQTIDSIFSPLVKTLDEILFWDPIAAMGIDAGVKIPFIIIWLIFGALFFTIYFRFINITGFKHAIDIVRGKFDKNGHKGEISHFQALATATASTVGLGNIAGVAVAISMGGPGATFWMIIAGFLGMTTKFVECSMGVKYRTINPDGSVSGGPMYYLSKGLKSKGFAKTGRFLAITFAIFAAIGAFVLGNMFQANQVIAQFVNVFPALESFRLFMGIAMAVLVGIVILGGIKGIARINDKLFPTMAMFYILSCIIVLAVNYQNLLPSFALIFERAFSPEGVGGGALGVMIVGFRRAAFSNEAGIGSAAIAHSTVKTEKPVTEGFVALLEPFIDTVVICTLTALVIISTGMYQNTHSLNGVALTSTAFSTVSSWFPYLLLPTIFMFAYSTIISWSYYGVKSFDYLVGNFFERRFGKRIIATRIYQVVFLLLTVVGCLLSLNMLVDFSDMLVLAMAVPNIIGLLFLSPDLRKDVSVYLKSLRKQRNNK